MLWLCCESCCVNIVSLSLASGQHSEVGSDEDGFVVVVVVVFLEACSFSPSLQQNLTGCKVAS